MWPKGKRKPGLLVPSKLTMNLEITEPCFVKCSKLSAPPSACSVPQTTEPDSNGGGVSKGEHGVGNGGVKCLVTVV